MKGRSNPGAQTGRGAWQSIGFALLEPSSLQVIPLHVFPGSVRVRKILAVVKGTSSPSVPVTIKAGSALEGGDAVTIGTVTADSTSPTFTFTDTALKEDSVIWAEIGSVTGVPEAMSVTLAYETY